MLEARLLPSDNYSAQEAFKKTLVLGLAVGKSNCLRNRILTVISKPISAGPGLSSSIARALPLGHPLSKWPDGNLAHVFNSNQVSASSPPEWSRMTFGKHCVCLFGATTPWTHQSGGRGSGPWVPMAAQIPSFLWPLETVALGMCAERNRCWPAAGLVGGDGWSPACSCLPKTAEREPTEQKLTSSHVCTFYKLSSFAREKEEGR